MMNEVSGNSGELKPCECGANNNAFIFSCYGLYQIECLSCFKRSKLYSEKSEVIHAWNGEPTYDELLEKFQQLRAKWDAIPWDEIYIVCKNAEAQAGYSMFGTQKVINWIGREAPPPNKDALAAELEQIRRAVANIFPNEPKEPHA